MCVHTVCTSVWMFAFTHRHAYSVCVWCSHDVSPVVFTCQCLSVGLGEKHMRLNLPDAPYELTTSSPKKERGDMLGAEHGTLGRLGGRYLHGQRVGVGEGGEEASSAFAQEAWRCRPPPLPLPAIFNSSVGLRLSEHVRLPYPHPNLSPPPPPPPLPCLFFLHGIFKAHLSSLVTLAPVFSALSSYVAWPPAC